ncbi:Snf7 [Carpediemonas membranifera]|uniref:Snf7 n=1 Tax=Carpediemonas membranifera TaxID=201153 RepID=A0A8J6E483_9EUKA|nr:Snf7 [Carpediemonas membranifera]QNO39406.1 vacuolar protein sorting 2 [Carpediemonas membranifera]|eukprot:KAG9394132.1 Snf7 [Carpediemonas membranifera]
MSLFGKKVPVADQLKQHKRSIDRACREIERERNKFRMQEQKIMAEIRDLAKKDQLKACEILAKDLVRTRSFQVRMMKMRANLQTVGLRIQTLKSSEALTSTMGRVAAAMGRMNQQMNLPELQKVMREFEKNNAKMENADEFVGDTIDDIFEASDEEVESANVLSSVLAELGISSTEGLTAAGMGVAPQAVAQQDDLAARMDKLGGQR